MNCISNPFNFMTYVFAYFMIVTTTGLAGACIIGAYEYWKENFKK